MTCLRINLTTVFVNLGPGLHLQLIKSHDDDDNL